MAAATNTQTSVKNATNLKINELQKNLNFPLLYKYIEAKESIFTDYFNVLVVSKMPDYMLKVNFVTFNSVDQSIFSKWFNIGRDAAIRSNQLNVLVNPPTIQPGVACVFTQPRPNISKFLLAFDLNDINASSEPNLPVHMLMTLSLSPSRYNCDDYSCLFFGNNTMIDSANKLDILLQILAVVPVNITTELYENIKKSVGNYALYRRILIVNNDNPLNPYIRDPVVTCKYSRSGIKL